MRGRWFCHEATIIDHIIGVGGCDGAGLLSEPVVESGGAAARIGGAVFSFFVCEFCVGYRVRGICGGIDRGDFSGTVIYIYIWRKFNLCHTTC
jgi:hypothetical protein